MPRPLGSSFARGLRTPAEPSGYPKNWNTISADFRKKCNYTCCICGVNCSDHPRLIDAHHKDHDKSNCRYENLRCLCKYHHRKQHPHYTINKSDMHVLQQLWREQNIDPDLIK